MLLGLRITNFAVIDEAEVEFGPGLTVLTGETGAGKSLVVDALGLALGGRAAPDLIRAGADEAAVEATFEATPALKARLESLGLPDLGSEVSVRRVLAREGRGKVHVNGALASVGVLAQLMRGKVDIAGQHEHIGLFDPGSHRRLLDRHAGLEGPLAAYVATLSTLHALDRELAELGGDGAKVAERVEFLRYQLTELEQFAPTAGEDEQLEAERRQLANVGRVREAADAVEALLCGQEGAALELVGRACGLLADAVKNDAALAPSLVALKASAAEMEEAARTVSRHAGSVEANPQRLLDVEDRLDGLRRLARKHGTGLDGLIARRDELAAQLAEVEGRSGRRESVTARRQEVESQARKAALGLSKARADAAQGFGRLVRDALRQLALPGAAFEVQVTPTSALGPTGLDDVEFQFSANSGEPARPLLKVASGGEASRVLLALKRVLAQSDESECYVLDEVDAGVSGATAEIVGRMIRDVSAHHQILCVTHLPQVAAFADTHLFVTKRREGRRTVSRLVPLGDGQERTRELARMLSGVEVTSEAVEAAQALVRSTHRRPRPGPAIRAGRTGSTRPQRPALL